MDPRVENPGCKEQKRMRGEQGGQQPKSMEKSRSLADEEGGQLPGWGRIRGMAVRSVCLPFSWTLGRTRGDDYKSHRRKPEVHGMEEAPEGQRLGGGEEVGRRGWEQSSRVRRLGAAVPRQLLFLNMRAFSPIPLPRGRYSKPVSVLALCLLYGYPRFSGGKILLRLSTDRRKDRLCHSHQHVRRHGPHDNK